MSAAVPISVIVPAYNVAPFLADALASVLAQTVRPAEVIVVDDGSTDATGAVAEGLGVRVIRQPNSGVSVARNAGLAASSGSWVAFLDGDDVWEAEKLEAQWQVAQAVPEAGLVFCDHAQFDAGGVRVASMFHARPNYQAIHRREVAPGIVVYDTNSLVAGVLEGNFLVPSSWCVRRSALDAAGRFDPALSGYCEDREYLLRLLRVTTAAAIERPLLRFRLRPGSLSSDDVNLHLGRALVARGVLDSPERYPRAAVASSRESLPLALKRAGLALVAAGRLGEARSAFVRSLRARFAPKTLLLIALTLLGTRAARLAVSLRQPGEQSRRDPGPG